MNEFIIADFTKGAIKHLTEKAGIERVSEQSYHAIRNVAFEMIEQWVENAIIVTQYLRRKTISDAAVIAVLPHKFYPLRKSGQACKPATQRKVKMRIKHYQKQHGCLLTAKEPFKRIVKHTIRQYGRYKISANAVITLQYCFEICMIDMLKNAYLIMNRNERNTLMPEDIKVANDIGHTQPASNVASLTGVKFNTYINRIMKQVHPQTSLNGEAMDQMSQYTYLFMNGILTRAALLLSMSGQSTLNSREIQAAARLLLPIELAKHAVSEGTKAIVVLQDSKQAARKRLSFRVGQIKRYMKPYAKRVGEGAAFYLTAIIEYMLAEILELGGNAARDERRTRITPANLYTAIRDDKELMIVAKELGF